MKETRTTDAHGRDKRLDWSNCMAEGRHYNIHSGERYSNGNEYIDYSEHDTYMKELWKDIELDEKLKDGKTYDFIVDDLDEYITVW